MRPSVSLLLPLLTFACDTARDTAAADDAGIGTDGLDATDTTSGVADERNGSSGTTGDDSGEDTGVAPPPTLFDIGFEGSSGQASQCVGEDCQCGAALHAGDPLAIPDGDGVSYDTSLNIQGFPTDSRLVDSSKLLSVCVVMEHSFIRDLEIDLTCPSGQVVTLNDFLGRSGDEVFLGEPIEDDEGTGVAPTPGVGYAYCWTANAENAPMLEYANEFAPDVLPAGDYRPSSSFDSLLDCELNGEWIFRVEDDWPLDNGFVFEWSLSFDESLIDDCSNWSVG